MDKDDTVVHYSEMKGSQQLFASKYRLIRYADDFGQDDESDNWLSEFEKLALLEVRK